MKSRLLLGALVVVLVSVAGCVAWRGTSGLIPVGVARVDISPTNAVRLMGYAARARLPAPTNIAQRIHARALAIGTGRDVALLLTIDNCILPGTVTQEVRDRLGHRLGLAPGQITLSVTHTHSAPCLRGAAPNIFAADMTATDLAQIGAYTDFLIGRLEDAAVTAMKDRRPARLAWGQGTVGFAKNRRTEGGPADHALPLLRVVSPEGKLRAVFVSYACHCTTLGGELNAVHGDWAGVAAQAIERDHPGAVALVAIGTGADANPDPRGTVALAERHGETLAREADRLLALPLVALTNAPTCRIETIQLPFQPHFTRAQWEARAAVSGIVGYHARKWLARLDRGEAPSPTLPYPVQTWCFGDQLAMVFLGGEVVADYGLRLKRDYDPDRLWVNAYANDVPCYIPSRRILAEGGYEAETSLWYYDRPQQLAPGIEELIHAAVRAQLPATFRADPKNADLPPMKSPAAALRSLRPRPGMRAELVVSEPLIESPVAIDFGTDGRLWVCEMRDYPSGLDGAGRPGGRVKALTDRDGDGVFDQARTFAEGFPFPTGLMAWGDGVLICAAPDILFAHDTDGDGKADRIETLFTGFATHNFQARVNGLRWGLDGWVYGAGGLFGGKIKSLRTGREIDASGRDFRFKPDTGEFEALAGVSQQGRVRDDFGEWFGNDNSTLLWHFPLPDRYARRNPFVAPAGARLSLARGDDPNRVFPASRTLARFNDPQAANHLTSGCGPEIYRDGLLGADFAGDAFVCEPVHNLVRRAKLRPEGVSFGAWRADDERDAEFLASTDNWFRPVEVRTGPDGALWVVDLNRFVVEHPRWITPERLKELDVRAGADAGRIWRMLPQGAKTRSIRDLTKLSPAQLAAVLDSPNGVERDLAHRELVQRNSTKSLPAEALDAIAALVRQCPRAASRVQALAVLATLGRLDDALLTVALGDGEAHVRRNAVRFSEGRDRLLPELEKLASDAALGVRYQLALSLGEFTGPIAERIFAALARRDLANPWMRSALLSSFGANAGPLLPDFRALSGDGRDEFVNGLLATVVGRADPSQLRDALVQAVAGGDGKIPPAESGIALRLYGAVLRRPEARALVEAGSDADARRAVERIQNGLLPAARAALSAGSLDENAAHAALEVFGELARSSSSDRSQLVTWFDTDLVVPIHAAVREALGRQTEPSLASQLLAGMTTRPTTRRNEVVALLLGREPWTEALLASVERGETGPGELTPVQRQALLRHGNPAIRQRARTLFASVVGSDRAEVVKRFAGVADLTGEPVRGVAHFDRLCAGCHRVRGRGTAVGPDLTPFRAKPVPDFLVAILDPSAAIEPRFIQYAVETRDGRSLSGIVRDETANGLTLAQATGLTEKLLRSDVAKLTAQPQSLMPEGLEQGMSPQDLADLISWLRAVPSAAAFGSATAEQIAKSRREFAATSCSITAKAGDLSYPGWLGQLPLNFCRQTAAESKLAWEAIAPAADADGSVRFRFAAAMGFVSQPAGEFELRVDGKPALKFNVALEDDSWASGDGAVRLSYLVRERNGEDSCGPLEVALSRTVAKPGDKVRFEVVGSSSGSQRWFGLYALPPER